MLLAFLITVAAGSATLVGALLALRPKMLRRSTMAVSLGFAAGAMILVAFMVMLPTSIEGLETGYGDSALTIAYAAFFGGIALMVLIDKLLPNRMNPSEREGKEHLLDDGLSQLDIQKLRRSGVLIAIAMVLHNVPEGLITFMGAAESPGLGISLAVAIALHNIPEGVAIAAPIYMATRSKKRALLYTGLASLAEPIGALLGFWLLSAALPVPAFDLVLAAVAGLMVFVCLDELLPAAKRYATSEHQAIYGVIAGMATMAISLLLFV